MLYILIFQSQSTNQWLRYYLLAGTTFLGYHSCHLHYKMLCSDGFIGELPIKDDDPLRPDDLDPLNDANKQSRSEELDFDE